LALWRRRIHGALLETIKLDGLPHNGGRCDWEENECSKYHNCALCLASISSKCTDESSIGRVRASYPSGRQNDSRLIITLTASVCLHLISCHSPEPLVRPYTELSRASHLPSSSPNLQNSTPKQQKQIWRRKSQVLHQTQGLTSPILKA
jgi:hypothetical protein